MTGHYNARRTEDADEDRELAQQQAQAKKPSASQTPRRCGFCANWGTPKGAQGRCSYCRQRFNPVPLVGMKPAF